LYFVQFNHEARSLGHGLVDESDKRTLFVLFYERRLTGLSGRLRFCQLLTAARVLLMLVCLHSCCRHNV